MRPRTAPTLQLLLSAPLREQRPGVVAGGFGLAAEHSGDFADPFLLVKQVISEIVRPASTRLVTTKCDAAAGRDRGQMGDADDLAPARDLPHFLARPPPPFRRPRWRRFRQRPAAGFHLRRPKRFSAPA